MPFNRAEASPLRTAITMKYPNGRKQANTYQAHTAELFPRLFAKRTMKTIDTIAANVEAKEKNIIRARSAGGAVYSPASGPAVTAPKIIPIKTSQHRIAEKRLIKNVRSIQRRFKAMARKFVLPCSVEEIRDAVVMVRTLRRSISAASSAAALSAAAKAKISC